MAGIQSRPDAGQIGGLQPGKKQPSVFDNYGGAVDTQSQDYDRIMKGFQDQGAKPDIAPIQYNGSPEVSNALSSLRLFTQNGGFSDSDLSSIRERGISPIRSVYANAQRNLDRNKVISGGYSPGYAGATAKMAREQSAQIGKSTNDVNANIAQMVQQGKLASLSPYASLASSEAGRGLDVSKFNAGLEGENRDRSLNVLKSQQSLYGTNPALASTFGNQALNWAQLGENQRQFDTTRMDRNSLARLQAAGSF